MQPTPTERLESAAEMVLSPAGNQSRLHVPLKWIGLLPHPTHASQQPANATLSTTHNKMHAVARSEWSCQWAAKCDGPRLAEAQPPSACPVSHHTSQYRSISTHSHLPPPSPTLSCHNLRPNKCAAMDSNPA
eukprot:12720-Prymnesium_polylepis.1